MHIWKNKQTKVSLSLKGEKCSEITKGLFSPQKSQNFSLPGLGECHGQKPEQQLHNSTTEIEWIAIECSE